MIPDHDVPAEPEADGSFRSTTMALIRRFRAGEGGAFAELFARHAPGVRSSLVLKLGRSRDELKDIDDVLQEAFLEVWDRLLRGESDAAFATVGGFRRLLVTIAQRNILDDRRTSERRKRDRSRTQHLDPWAEHLQSRQPSPSEGLRAKEVEEKRQTALLTLSPADRQVLDGRDHLGMSYDELARELGCRPAAVKLRHFRAKERLAQAVRRLMEA